MPVFPFGGALGAGNRLGAMHMYQIQQRMVLNGLPRAIQAAVHRLKTDPELTELDLSFGPEGAPRPAGSRRPGTWLDTESRWTTLRWPPWPPP